MNQISLPSYYMMSEEHDVFTWLESLPLPTLPNDIAVAAIGKWVTGFRYARRCLWKKESLKGKADDARKAATCFLRLAELLDAGAFGEALLMKGKSHETPESACRD